MQRRARQSFQDAVSEPHRCTLLNQTGRSVEAAIVDPTRVFRRSGARPCVDKSPWRMGRSRSETTHSFVLELCSRRDARVAYRTPRPIISGATSRGSKVIGWPSAVPTQYAGLLALNRKELNALFSPPP